MVAARIPFPWFTFMLKDLSGAIFLRSGPDVFMPIFTNQEAAELYQGRSLEEFSLVELPIVPAALAYLENPPSRAENDDNLQFRIAIDPISPTDSEFYSLGRDVLISALKAQLGQ